MTVAQPRDASAVPSSRYAASYTRAVSRRFDFRAGFALWSGTECSVVTGQTAGHGPGPARSGRKSTSHTANGQSQRANGASPDEGTDKPQSTTAEHSSRTCCDLSTRTIEALAASAMQRRGLTPMQIKVMLLAMTDCKDRDLARRLGIGYATVRTHINHGYRKLGVCTRAGMTLEVFKDVLSTFLASQSPDDPQ